MTSPLETLRGHVEPRFWCRDAACPTCNRSRSALHSLALVEDLLIDMGEHLRAVRFDSLHDYEKRKALLARLDRLGNTT